nr:hypothetical protein CFP56_10463 [Quercus suber]
MLTGFVLYEKTSGRRNEEGRLLQRYSKVIERRPRFLRLALRLRYRVRATARFVRTLRFRRRIRDDDIWKLNARTHGCGGKESAASATRSGDWSKRRQANSAMGYHPLAESTPRPLAVKLLGRGLGDDDDDDDDDGDE